MRNFHRASQTTHRPHLLPCLLGSTNHGYIIKLGGLLVSSTRDFSSEHESHLLCVRGLYFSQKIPCQLTIQLLKFLKTWSHCTSRLLQTHLIYWQCGFRVGRTQLRDTPEVICPQKVHWHPLRGANGLSAGEKQHKRHRQAVPTCTWKVQVIQLITTWTIN